MNKVMFKKQIVKTALILIFAFSYKVSNAQMRSASWLTKTDTAFVPKEIEDPECIGINKQPAHATLMPYANLTEALKANRHASTYAKTLNGLWKFNWVGWPQQRPVDFYKTTYNVDKWATIKVPSNWQIEGYGTPYYSNYNYIFQKDFPHVMSTPPVSFTAYKERNPVGSYRRNFEVPLSWKGRRIFVTFDGVDAGFVGGADIERLLQDVGDRREVARQLDRQVRRDAGRARQRQEGRGRRHIERVAVGRLLRRELGRDAAARAGLVQRDDLLVPDLGEPVADHPRSGVIGGARRGIDHDADRVVGIVRLRAGVVGDEQRHGQGRDGEQALHVHAHHSFGFGTCLMYQS